MAHRQPNPGHTARRLASMAVTLAGIAAQLPACHPHLDAVEQVWTDMTHLAADLHEAAIPCDVPDCPGAPAHHAAWYAA